MSRIFTIGTRKRSTKTLEEQAKKAQSEMINQLNAAISAIESEDYNGAYSIIYNQYNRVDYALSYLNSALNDMSGQDYTAALSDIRHAIEELK